MQGVQPGGISGATAGLSHAWVSPVRPRAHSWLLSLGIPLPFAFAFPLFTKRAGSSGSRPSPPSPASPVHGARGGTLPIHRSDRSVTGEGAGSQTPGKVPDFAQPPAGSGGSTPGSSPATPSWLRAPAPSPPAQHRPAGPSLKGRASWGQRGAPGEEDPGMLPRARTSHLQTPSQTSVHPTNVFSSTVSLRGGEPTAARVTRVQAGVWRAAELCLPPPPRPRA